MTQAKCRPPRRLSHRTSPRQNNRENLPESQYQDTPRDNQSPVRSNLNDEENDMKVSRLKIPSFTPYHLSDVNRLYTDSQQVRKEVH